MSIIPIIAEKMRKCAKCNKEFAATLEYFNRNRRRKGGLQPYCKQCQSEDYQIHKVERRQYKNQYQKEYRKTIQGHLRDVWHAMLQRCNKPKHKAYKNYGGRGIKLKFISLNDFRNYVINDLNIDPRGLTIDRIDNDCNYERGNIRFITKAENNRNRRKQFARRQNRLLQTLHSYPEKKKHPQKSRIHQRNRSGT